MTSQSQFTQLCVWPGTVLGESSEQDFVDFFKNELNTRIQFLEEVETLPSTDENGPIAGTGGRNDIFFYVHSDDVMKFAVPRLGMGIRWWEDVLGNGHGDIYPAEILEKYSKNW